MKSSLTYMQAVDNRHWCHWIFNRAHALKEGVFGLVCTDDGPRRTVIDHLLVGLLRTWGGLQENVAWIGIVYSFIGFVHLC